MLDWILVIVQSFKLKKNDSNVHKSDVIVCDEVDGSTAKENNKRMLRGRSRSQARNSEIEYKWKEISKVGIKDIISIDQY